MKIFMGSSSEAADKDILLKIAGILRSAGAEPVPWNTSPSIFKAGMTTIENLEKIKKQLPKNVTLCAPFLSSSGINVIITQCSDHGCRQRC